MERRDFNKQDVETIKYRFRASNDKFMIFLIKYMALIQVQLLAKPLTQILNYLVLLSSNQVSLQKSEGMVNREVPRSSFTMHHSC